MERQFEFGEKLSDLRKSRHMTQQELATQLNVTESTVCNWEKERRFPDIYMLSRIADYFDVSVDELLRSTDMQKRIETEPVQEDKENNACESAACLILGLILLYQLIMDIVSYQDSGPILIMEEVTVIVLSIMGYIASKKGMLNARNIGGMIILICILFIANRMDAEMQMFPPKAFKDILLSGSILRLLLVSAVFLLSTIEFYYMARNYFAYPVVGIVVIYILISICRFVRSIPSFRMYPMGVICELVIYSVTETMACFLILWETYTLYSKRRRYRSNTVIHNTEKGGLVSMFLSIRKIGLSVIALLLLLSGCSISQKEEKKPVTNVSMVLGIDETLFEKPEDTLTQCLYIGCQYLLPTFEDSYEEFAKNSGMEEIAETYGLQIEQGCEDEIAAIQNRRVILCRIERGQEERWVIQKGFQTVGEETTFYFYDLKGEITTSADDFTVLEKLTVRLKP